MKRPPVMKLRYLSPLATLCAALYTALCAGFIPMLLGLCHSAHAETLQEILSSEEMRRISERNNARYRTSSRKLPDGYEFLVGIDPNSEFARIWKSNRGADLLLNWLGVNLPGYTVVKDGSKRSHELAYAGATLSTRGGERVAVEVLIPHPTYHTMVQLKTLKAFKVYEPPTLETVAQEQLTFKQTSGMYYRTPRGQCSILIKVEKLGIVNLSVKQCELSNRMTAIVNALDFERLNKKLTS